MKKKFKIILSALCLAAILVGPSAASAGGNWQGCGGSPKPCYDNN